MQMNELGNIGAIKLTDDLILKDFNDIISLKGMLSNRDV